MRKIISAKVLRSEKLFIIWYHIIHFTKKKKKESDIRNKKIVNYMKEGKKTKIKCDLQSNLDI